MDTPDWLRAGTVVWDPDDERWEIRAVNGPWVELRHAQHGQHRLRCRDLVDWVEDGNWRTIE